MKTDREIFNQMDVYKDKGVKEFKKQLSLNNNIKYVKKFNNELNVETETKS